jgi:FkbM family methyltransferase
MEALLAFARRIRTSFGNERLWSMLRPIYWAAISIAPGSKNVRVEFPDGRCYRIDAQFYAWQVNQYELPVVRELTGTLTQNSVLYDVGAHVGIISLIAAAKVSHGHVYAFEPSPANFRYLNHHIRINEYVNRINAERVLVGEQHSDDVPFVCRPGQFTANSLAYAIDGGQATPTPMVTIDGIVKRDNVRPPTHIKIDVEGYEAAVLKGATFTLRKFRPIVICAVHPEPLRLLGETPAGLVEHVVAQGYQAFTLKGEPVITPGFEEIVFRPVTKCGMAGPQAQ